MATREVPCPECHKECGWCSWYAKNARGAGCGNTGPTGRRQAKKYRCEWDALKGTTCPLCGGAEKVTMTYDYSRTGGSNG